MYLNVCIAVSSFRILSLTSSGNSLMRLKIFFKLSCCQNRKTNPPFFNRFIHILNVQYVISATRGLSTKTNQKGVRAEDHGSCLYC